MMLAYSEHMEACLICIFDPFQQTIHGIGIVGGATGCIGYSCRGETIYSYFHNGCKFVYPADVAKVFLCKPDIGATMRDLAQELFRLIEYIQYKADAINIVDDDLSGNGQVLSETGDEDIQAAAHEIIVFPPELG